jgi:trimeric autotransporter adhesin
MSTKTTFKRVALVAVAALGLGVLTVAPAANAASAAPTVGLIGASVPHRVGVASATPYTFTLPSGFVGGTDTFTVAAKVTSAPAGSIFNSVGATGSNNNVADANGRIGAANTYAGRISFAAATSILSANANGSSPAATGGAETAAPFQTSAAYVAPAASATSATINVMLQADVAGTYTVMVSTSLRSVATAAYASGDTSWTYTVTTAGAPSAITLSAVNATAAEGTTGSIVKVTLKDAAGNATIPGVDESLDLTGTSSVTLARLDGSGGATTSLNSSSFATGTAYFRATLAAITADTTSVITAAGGGQLSSSLLSTVSISFKELAATDATTVIGLSALELTGYSAITNATVNSDSEFAVALAKTSHGLTVTLSAAAAADTVVGVLVTDSSGRVTGRVGTTYATAVTVAKAATTASLTISGTMGVAGRHFVADLVFDGDAAGTSAAEDIAIQGAAAVNTAVAVTPGLVSSATAATNTFVATVTDQFGNTVSNVAVTVTVAGRNSAKAAVQLATDANGQVSYALTDSGTSGTADVVTFTTVTDGATKSATINYGTVTVAKVSFTGPNTASGVAAATTTVSPIRANDTPEASTAAASVVVTDAAGNLLAGVPVVFTVSGTTAAITSDVVTVYTDSAGKAASTVFAWVAGTYTVTATAGGVTGTGSYTFANSTAADARVLSATVEGGNIMAKVVDRFGNPVSGVSVYVSRTSGTGYFGTGVSKTTTTTGTDGIAEFTMIGAAEVKVSTLDYAAAAGTNAFGQTCALAGNLTCASGATAAKAFTATTAGTTSTAGENIGSSFAPAGVSSVSVSVNNNAAADSATAAADAAAEATDAANAATDAANAAAEAADAATAAAQDAADAVAALSTQVSEMVDALKKQITALTNLVIKIQKKVKA